MKILIVRNFPSYYSLKNNTYNIQEIGLAKALVRKGNICDIVFWTDENEKTIDYSFDNSLSLKIYYRLGKTALKNTILKIDDLIPNYDVIQPCEYNQIQSWILAKKFPQKTIIYHGPYYSNFNKKYNLMCSVFDLLCLPRYRKLKTHFIVKSQLARQFLNNKGLINILDIGVGVDSQVLGNNKEKCSEPIFNSMLTSSDLRLLYIGRLEPRRNIEFIFNLLANLNQYVNAKLFIIGNGDSDYVDSVFSLASELNIEDKIVWQKKMEQKYMSNIYQYTDYFLLPTYYEIFGMVLLEAMYFRNVVLTTNNGGSSTLINDGENGFILPQNDIKKWVNTILNVEKDFDKKKKIENSANLTIINGFTWDKLADKFIEEYKKVGK